MARAVHLPCFLGGIGDLRHIGIDHRVRRHRISQRITHGPNPRIECIHFRARPRPRRGNLLRGPVTDRLMPIKSRVQRAQPSIGIRQMRVIPSGRPAKHCGIKIDMNGRGCVTQFGR